MIFRYLLFAVVVWGICFALWHFVRWFYGISSTSTQRAKDLAFLKKKINFSISELTKMTKEALDSLTLFTTKTKGLKPLGAVTTGMYYTIFEEPLFMYAKKYYPFTNNESIIIIATEKDDFTYINYGDKTKLYINGRHKGFILSDGRLLDQSERKELARIELDEFATYRPVYINGKEVGQVVDPNQNTLMNSRAFPFVEPMEEQDFIHFQVLTFLSLVES